MNIKDYIDGVKDFIYFKWDLIPKYVKYSLLGLIFVGLTILGYNFIAKNTPLAKEKLSSQYKKDSIVNVDNTSNIKIKPDSKSNLNLTDKKQDNTNNKTTNKSNKDESLKKKIINLNKINVKTNKLFNTKNNIQNISSLPKDVLNKLKNKSIQNYKNLLKDNIVKKYGIRKVVEADLKLAYHFYRGYFSAIIIPYSKLKTLLNIKNIKTTSVKKCIKVFGKENCKYNKYVFLLYKGKKILYSTLQKAITSNKAGYAIFLIRKINGIEIADKYLNFDPKYGWYGLNILKVYRNAIINNNYKIMYIFDVYNINSLWEGYKKNILQIIQDIIGTQLIN